MKKEKVFDLFYDYDNMDFVFKNFTQDWKDERIKSILEKLNIKIKDSVEMFIIDELFLGDLIDDTIRIAMDETSAIKYYEFILNKLL